MVSRRRCRAIAWALAACVVLTPALALAAETIAGPQLDAAALRRARDAKPGPELRLVFDLQHGASAPTPVTVWLGADYIDVVEAQHETLYDFKLRRRLLLNRTAGTFANASLYSDIAFRRVDMENRLSLLRALGDSGHAKEIPVSLKPFWIESDLGVPTLAGPPPTIKTETLADGAVRFRADDQEVALFAPEGAAQSPEIRRLFARFLRYRLPLHPDVIAAIARDGRLPQRIVFVTAAGDERRPAALILRRRDLVRSDYPLPLGLQPRPVPASAEDADASTMRTLLPIMLDAVAGKGGEGVRSLGDYRRAVDAAFQRKAGFDVALRLAAMTLEYGRAASDCASGPRDVPCHTTPEINQLLAGDKRATALYHAQAIETKDPAEAIAQWKKLKRDDAADGYVVDIFMADRLSLSGQRADAASAFVTAFRANPSLAGLYKDLGDHFLRGLRADLAWYCYDLGRALPGRSPADTLALIDTVEQEFAAQYPDFF